VSVGEVEPWYAGCVVIIRGWCAGRLAHEVTRFRVDSEDLNRTFLLNGTSLLNRINPTSGVAMVMSGGHFVLEYECFAWNDRDHYSYCLVLCCVAGAGVFCDGGHGRYL
jgi:hypothetical protein